MKKITTVLIASIFSFCVINAQTYETLTNSDITKMAKARLSDELIIDMIQSSPVNFDLSESSLNNLKTENISSGVIEAMKAASIKPGASTIKEGSEPAPAMLSIPSATGQKHEEKPNNESATVTVQTESNMKTESAVVTALGYTTPIKGLVEFYEQETDELSNTISEWDKEIKLMLMEAGEINDQILKIESDLREKKNSNSEKYGTDILLLKKKLGEKRAEYKKVKEKMTLNGQNIIKNLATISKKQTQTISKNYSDACRQIIAFDANPAIKDKGTDIVFKKMNINDNTTYYISPATEMLYWHQNEIGVLQKLVSEWNIRVKDVISKDAELSRQLEPLSSSMLEYKANPKKYKKEISALKKQMGTIENERKKLNTEMENDSENLSDQLKVKSMEAQNSVRERIADIMENINYTYQEKLNL